MLRDSQRLAIDLLENPAPVIQAFAEANRAWLRYWQAATGAIHQWIDGYYYWMGIWSDQPSTDLQCDFNVLISSRMFDEFFLPYIEEQTRWVERTIFHLDGPGAIRHLDSLLSLPRLDGIQWVPGDGKPAMSKWLPCCAASNPKASCWFSLANRGKRRRCSRSWSRKDFCSAPSATVRKRPQICWRKSPAGRHANSGPYLSNRSCARDHGLAEI